MHLAKKTGSGSPDEILANNHTRDYRLCMQYVKSLQKKGRRKDAIKVLKKGLGRFSEDDFRIFALGLLKKTDPKYRETLRDLYLSTGHMTYLATLKKMTPRWPPLRRSIISRLEKSHSYYFLIELLLKEGMYRRALNAVFSSSHPYSFMDYHKVLCHRFPKEYHAKYKKELTSYAKQSCERRHYEKIKSLLLKMKTVLGHKSKFTKFVESLRERYSHRPAFLQVIKNVTR